MRYVILIRFDRIKSGFEIIFLPESAQEFVVRDVAIRINVIELHHRLEFDFLRENTKAQELGIRVSEIKKVVGLTRRQQELVRILQYRAFCFH